MRLVVDGLQALFGDVRVALGGAEGGVAEEFLHSPEVASGVEEVRGEGVADHVRMDVAVHGGAADDGVEDHPNGPGSETPAARVQPQGLFAARGPAPARVKIRAEGRRGGIAEGDDAFLVAFSQHADPLRGKIGAVDIESHQLRHADARRVEHLENGRVAEGQAARRGIVAVGGAFDQLCDFIQKEKFRKAAFAPARGANAGRGRRCDAFGAGHETKETPDAREFPADRRGLKIFFRKLVEVGSKIGRGGVGPSRPAALFVKHAKVGQVLAVRLKRVRRCAAFNFQPR